MDYSRAEALRELRREQELARKRYGSSLEPVNDSVLDDALAAAERRETEVIIKNGRVQDFAFSYPLALEQKRWARTRDIIHRVSPGPNEDATYLEIVARQAASIEMILRQEHTDTANARVSDLCDRVLIATIPSFSPKGSSRTVKNHFIVLLSAGLIDFVYQVAKAVVLSCRATSTGPRRVRIEEKPEVMDKVLAANPRLVSHFMATYVSYLYHGEPRVARSPVLPPEHKFALTPLTNFNERFILAHEYGHTLIDSLGFDFPGHLTRHGEELDADTLAFDLLMMSGAVLEGMPPTASARGAFFVLSVYETLRRALDIARHGEVGEDLGFDSHPPTSLRYQRFVQRYRDTISDQDDQLSIEGALAPSRSLMHLWQKIEGPLKAHRKIGLPLHQMWGEGSD